MFTRGNPHTSPFSCMCTQPINYLRLSSMVHLCSTALNLQEWRMRLRCCCYWNHTGSIYYLCWNHVVFWSGKDTCRMLTAKMCVHQLQMCTVFNPSNSHTTIATLSHGWYCVLHECGWQLMIRRTGFTTLDASTLTLLLLPGEYSCAHLGGSAPRTACSRSRERSAPSLHTIASSSPSGRIEWLDTSIFRPDLHARTTLPFFTSRRWAWLTI